MKHPRQPVPLYIALAVLTFAAVMSLSVSTNAAEPPPTTTASAAPSTGDGALFTAFVSVLRHPRCMNCHSRGDFPRQGDDGHPDAMNVRRGPEVHRGHGEKCSPCDQDHDLAGAHLPPGAPN